MVKALVSPVLRGNGLSNHATQGTGLTNRDTSQERVIAVLFLWFSV